MGLAEIKQRVLMELLDLEPIVEPPAPRAEWPVWSSTANDNTQEPPPEVRLRVLSLNAWGLPVAPKVTERAIEITNAIQDGWDLVVLQEIWHRRERNLIIARAEQAGYGYYHYFNPAVGFPVPLGAADSFGTGLLVLSKFPIVSAMYHPFSLTGRPYALHEADFIANKGCGLLRVQTAAGQIDVYVTHLLANYNHLGQPGPGDRYIAHRAAQSYELSQFISATARNPLTLVCGDFNSPSDCVVLRIPREVLQLRDAFTDMNAHDGLTFATEDNKFSHGDHPMRMDYILYKINQHQHHYQQRQQQQRDRASPSWHLVHSDVFKSFFTDEKGEQCPLSDHFGVSAEFVFGSRPVPLKPCQQALGEGSKERASPVAKHTPAHLRTCPTTTCIYCDELNGEGSGTKLTADGFTPAVRCLQDVQHMLLEGRTEAIRRRAGHLRRSAISVFAILSLLVLQIFALLPFSSFVWPVIVALTVHCVLEYILAFYFVTFECSTFTELANQLRLHLHAEQAKDAVL